MARAARRYPPLAFELACAVDRQRRRGNVLRIGVPRCSVEYVIRRIVHHKRVRPLRLRREHFGCDRIDGEGSVAIGFGCVDLGVCRGIDDDRGPHRPHRGGDRVHVGEVERASTGCDEFPQRREQRLQFRADLTLDTRQQDGAQGKTSASFSSVPAASFAASVGTSTSGHSIESAGSLHNSVRSCSG